MDFGDALKMLLSFLLQFAELIIAFLISALTLFIEFFRTLVGSVQ